MQDTESAIEYLRRLGRSGEGPHDIALAALMLSSLDHPGVSLAPAKAHLEEIAALAASEAPSIASAEQGARAVSNLMAGRLGYDGDRLTFDDPRNADLIEVMARRRGLPVALGILYLHAARSAGLSASGLDAPAHFLVLFAKNRSEALIDPFNGGATLDADRVGAPPRMGGAQGAHLNPVSDIDVLLRLQNNMKVRALQAGEHGRALEIAKRMALIGPAKAELWLDLARLNEHLGVLGDARKAYEACLEIARPGQNLHNEAALALSGLKRRIN
ncbi:MAG TPA: transglutaminase-like domain-containing protein [Rhizomicrobium sp.]|nr:transglutaminase-like domain-containing protein [Rhizomicrobium sp.]